MTFARRFITTLALIVAVLTAAALPLGAERAQAACASMKHACSQAAAIKKCCCGDSSTPTHQGGPTESKVQVFTDLSIAPAFESSLVAPQPAARLRRRAAPPLTVRLDLPTLFASLLL